MCVGGKMERKAEKLFNLGWDSCDFQIASSLKSCSLVDIRYIPMFPSSFSAYHPRFTGLFDHLPTILFWSRWLPCSWSSRWIWSRPPMA